MQTSLIIGYKDSNNQKGQQTITYVDANASGSQLATLANKIIGLTDNELTGVTRVDKTAITSKTAPTLTLSKSTETCANIVAACTGETEPYAYEVTVNYNGDGELSAVNECSKTGAIVSDVYKIGDEYKLRVVWVNTDSARGTVTVKAAETDTFAAAQTVFTITA